MKKILLAAAVFAVASISSFGAACVDGTLASLAGSSCTIQGWTLDTWGLAANPAQTGFSANPTTADIFVSFQTLLSGGGALGFQVSFSDAPGGNNFFSTISGNPNQTASFKTLFVVSGAPIAEVANTITGGTTTVGNNGSVVLQKILTDAANPGNPTITDGTILVTSAGTSTNPLTIYSNQASPYTKMGIVDNYQISAGNNGAASLTSYTNTFFGVTPPTGNIPEPMTFVLMGAGLVGIAALRRRNG